MSNNQRNKLLKRYVIYSAFVAAALFILFTALRPAAIPVDVGTVTQGVFTQVVEEDGRTRAKDMFDITAPVSGIMQRLKFDVGDRVKKGQLLVVIAPSLSALLDVREELRIKERVGAAEAAYERAKVLVEKAKAAYSTSGADLRRKAALAKKGYVSQSELERVQLDSAVKQRELESEKLNVDAALHDVQQAKASLRRVKNVSATPTDVEHVVNITSPIDGEIIKISRESQGPISSGTMILKVADTTQLEIIVDILSTDAVQIKPGAKVMIKRWGGEGDLEGKVRLVEPGGFTKISALGVEEQRVNVIIDITSSPERWQNIGAEFRVEVEVAVFAAEDVLQVPVSALFRDGAHWAVFMLDGSHARLHRIAIGRRNNRTAIATEGLSKGDSVIIYPSERVKDGVRVNVRNI